MLGIIMILGVSWLLIGYIEKENLSVLWFSPIKNRIFQFAIGLGFIFVLKLLFILIDTQILSISWIKSSSFNLNSFFLSFWYHLKSALTEDLIFRGALLYILIKKIGLQKGLLASALAFGIYHWFSYGIISSGRIILLIYVLITTGFTGYVWAYTFAKTKSIMLPLGFHFGWNFINTMFYDAQLYGHLIFEETAKIELSDPYNTYYSLFIGLTPALLTLIFVKKLIKKEIFMNFKFLILIFCTITSSGCGQQTNKLIAPSSWIGKVKMGDANPEVVFNIFKDSLGQLTGNLGVPSKGVQSIPLSKVYIKQDSIILESSTAQLVFKGVFENNGKTIKGNWIEPQLTSSLILVPLTKTIDYDNFKKENTSSLNLEFESKHFNFYSKKADASVLENLSKSLESNYLRITEDMKTNFESKIDVFIYPNIKSFHSAINVPDAPGWVVGVASKNELKMVSPLKPGNQHTYESLMKAIVHELTHAIVLNFSKQGLVGLPNWLNEGYAYYEAKQLNESQRELVLSQLLNNKIPSWSELEKANNYQFGDMNGYPISATIIEFLVKSYGVDKLKQFIIEPENVNYIYKLSKENLEVLWLRDLKQNKNAIKN